MQVMFRRDSPIAILAFGVVIPEVPASVEVARLYTTVEHVRRIVEVLSKNLERYDAEIAEADSSKTKQQK